MDLSDDDLRQIADELGVPLSKLQSDAVKECAESVKADNPDMSTEEAFAVCQDMENEGLLADTFVTLADVEDPGDIERIEQDDGSVRYTSIMLLAPGVWGDSGTQRQFLYTERTSEHLAENVESNTLNLFHERENEVTDIGTLDEDTLFVGVDDGALYGDIVLHMDNAASAFADEALQNAFETDGREGLQGPSLEIKGQEYEFNEEHGVHELIEGSIIGAGLVGLGVSPGPGSKDAAFAKQTQQRAVALATHGDAALFKLQKNDNMNTDYVLEQLGELGISLQDGPDEETLKTLAESFGLELQEDDDDEEEEEEPEDNSDDEAEDEDEEMDMQELATQVQQNQQAITELSEQIVAIAEATELLQDDEFSLSELQESVTSLSESLDTLAGSDRIDELESRLSELEDEPEEASSLMDIELQEQTEADDSPGSLTPIQVSTYR